VNQQALRPRPLEYLPVMVRAGDGIRTLTSEHYRCGWITRDGDNVYRRIYREKLLPAGAEKKTLSLLYTIGFIDGDQTDELIRSSKLDQHAANLHHIAAVLDAAHRGDLEDSFSKRDEANDIDQHDGNVEEVIMDIQR
jgi:hypothetical protein